MATLDERISTIVGSWRWPATPTVNFTCAGHSSPRVRVNSEHTNSQSAMPLDTYYAELPVTDCAHRLASKADLPTTCRPGHSLRYAPNVASANLLQQLPEPIFAPSDLLQNFLEKAPVQVPRM